jgi:hypothetical protein
LEKALTDAGFRPSSSGSSRSTWQTINNCEERTALFYSDQQLLGDFANISMFLVHNNMASKNLEQLKKDLSRVSESHIGVSTAFKCVVATTAEPDLMHLVWLSRTERPSNGTAALVINYGNVCNRSEVSYKALGSMPANPQNAVDWCCSIQHTIVSVYFDHSSSKYHPGHNLLIVIGDPCSLRHAQHFWNDVEAALVSHGCISPLARRAILTTLRPSPDEENSDIDVWRTRVFTFAESFLVPPDSIEGEPYRTWIRVTLALQPTVDTLQKKLAAMFQQGGRGGTVVMVGHGQKEGFLLHADEHDGNDDVVFTPAHLRESIPKRAPLGNYLVMTCLSQVWSIADVTDRVAVDIIDVALAGPEAVAEAWYQSGCKLLSMMRTTAEENGSSFISDTDCFHEELRKLVTSFLGNVTPNELATMLLRGGDLDKFALGKDVESVFDAFMSDAGAPPAGGLRVVCWPAAAGDAVSLIVEKDGYWSSIMIDSGYKKAFAEYVWPHLLRAKSIGGAVLTHMDADHIGGFLAWARDSRVEVMHLLANAPYEWVAANMTRGSDQLKRLLQAFPTGTAPVIQRPYRGLTLDTDRGVNSRNTHFEGGAWECGLSLVVIAPTSGPLAGPEGAAKMKDIGVHISYDQVKRDDSMANGASTEPATGNMLTLTNHLSVVLMAEMVRGDTIFRLLFTGDAGQWSIFSGLRANGYLPPLGDISKHISKSNPLDFLWVPHHGSEKNSNGDFFTTLPALRYCVSTDGRNPTSNHPHKSVIDNLVAFLSLWLSSVATDRPTRPVEVKFTYADEVRLVQNQQTYGKGYFEEKMKQFIDNRQLKVSASLMKFTDTAAHMSDQACFDF